MYAGCCPATQKFDNFYTRILESCSKRTSYKAASEFLEKPSYKLHDVYRALDVLGAVYGRGCNYMGEQAYIVTQSIKKLKKGEKESALNPQGFISEEAGYDGLYAVCTDLLDDEVSDILKVSEGRWQIEECFRIMKTDFSARPVYLQDENRIRAHFLICFLALTLYRFLEKKLDYKYTCGELLDTLKAMNFAEIQEQGFIPLYRREFITDALHEVCGFRTDYQFITKSSMRTIQKKSKGKE